MAGSKRTGHRAVAGVIADAQSAAAVLVHTVAGLELFVLAGALAGRALRAAGALGLTLAGADSLRAGSGHGGAGVGDILHGAGGDVVGTKKVFFRRPFRVEDGARTHDLRNHNPTL